MLKNASVAALTTILLAALIGGVLRVAMPGVVEQAGQNFLGIWVWLVSIAAGVWEFRRRERLRKKPKL